MVRAYCLDSVQQKLHQSGSLGQPLFSDAPLSCALSESGLLFLATGHRTIEVFNVDQFCAVSVIHTVGVPRSICFSETGDYILTLEGSDGPSHVPLMDVFAYTKWSLSDKHQRRARACCLVGGEHGDQSDQVNRALPPEGPAVHSFRTSSSSPAIAVCSTSGQLVIGDAGTLTVYAFVASVCCFTAEKQVTLPFLAHDVALTGGVCAAIGDSRLIITWPSCSSCGSDDKQQGAHTGPVPALPMTALPAPATMLLPSMLKRLHDRRTTSFELLGADAVCMPLFSSGAQHDPPVVYRKFEEGEELHSLALLCLASTANGVTEAAGFVSTKHAGYLYALRKGEAELFCSFSYAGSAFKALLSPSIITVCTTSGIEVYTSKVFQSKDAAMYSQVCPEFKDPLLIAIKDIKGLVHCISSTIRTCYFTDHWQTYANLSIQYLSADMLRLAEELTATAASGPSGSALQVIAEGLRLCQIVRDNMDSSGGPDQAYPGTSETESIAETYRKLCVLGAATLLKIENLCGSTSLPTAAAVPGCRAAPEQRVLALYAHAGLTSSDAMLDQCLLAGSRCSAAVALQLLFQDCGCPNPRNGISSLDTANSLLALVAHHYPATLGHAVLHLVHCHPILLEESSWKTYSQSEEDACGAICMALATFHAGRVEETHAILGGATHSFAKKMVEVLANHPQVIVKERLLSDLAMYIRSCHTDLFIAVLMEILPRQTINCEDMLDILNKSCGYGSQDKKVYLEALTVYCLERSQPMEQRYMEELCLLLMDSLSRVARAGAHSSRDESYCVSHLTNELAKYRPSWLNESTLYPAAVHQMCTHKSGARGTHSSSRHMDVRTAAIGRWLCTRCHGDLLKLQGLLCCGMMDPSHLEAVVQGAVGGSGKSQYELPMAASLRLIGVAGKQMLQPDRSTKMAFHLPSMELVAALAVQCPAALPMLLRAAQPLCHDDLEDMFGFALKELSRQLMAIEEVESSKNDNLLHTLNDIMKLSSKLLTFDQLLAVLPANGSVSYFLPYLEHAAQQAHPEC